VEFTFYKSSYVKAFTFLNLQVSKRITLDLHILTSMIYTNLQADVAGHSDQGGFIKDRIIDRIFENLFYFGA